MRRIPFRATLLRAVALATLLTLAAGTAARAQAPIASSHNTPFSTLEQLNQIRANQTLERDFIRSRFQANEFEIQLLRIALCQSPSPDVRAFARNTLNRQLILDQMLYAFIRGLHIHSPNHFSRRRTSQLNRLQQLNGSAFNAAFLLSLRRDYRNDQQEYTHQSGISQGSGIQITLHQGLHLYSNRLAALHTLIRAHHATKSPRHQAPHQAEHAHPAGCSLASFSLPGPLPFTPGVKA